MRLLRDDAGVVYINGTEVFRSNLPQGVSIVYTTAASASASEADEFYQFHTTNANSRLLRDGTNLVAVEIHQSSSTSGDLSFDLELFGEVTIAPPPLQITRAAADCIALIWDDPTAVLEEASTMAGPWSAVMGGPASPYWICGIPKMQFYRLSRRP